MLRNVSKLDMFEKERVTFKLNITYEIDGQTKKHILNGIENRDYIFDEGVYRIVWEESGRFKRNLWEFKEIPNRTEIKFHSGKYTKHTKGCPLLTVKGLSVLYWLLDNKKEYWINVQNI